MKFIYIEKVHKIISIFLMIFVFMSIIGSGFIEANGRCDSSGTYGCHQQEPPSSGSEGGQSTGSNNNNNNTTDEGATNDDGDDGDDGDGDGGNGGDGGTSQTPSITLDEPTPPNYSHFPNIGERPDDFSKPSYRPNADRNYESLLDNSDRSYDIVLSDNETDRTNQTETNEDYKKMKAKADAVKSKNSEKLDKCEENMSSYNNSYKIKWNYFVSKYNKYKKWENDYYNKYKPVIKENQKLYNNYMATDYKDFEIKVANYRTRGYNIYVNKVSGKRPPHDYADEPYKNIQNPNNYSLESIIQNPAIYCEAPTQYVDEENRTSSNDSSNPINQIGGGGGIPDPYRDGSGFADGHDKTASPTTPGVPIDGIDPIIGGEIPIDIRPTDPVPIDGGSYIGGNDSDHDKVAPPTTQPVDPELGFDEEDHKWGGPGSGFYEDPDAAPAQNDFSASEEDDGWWPFW